ncbi:MAG: alpha-hydroxy-acid oxidizing protein [Acetobacteraceae bacterium]
MSACRRSPPSAPPVAALQELGVHREVQLVVSGGIRSGADVAKVLALGADAVAIGNRRADRARRQRPGAGGRIPRTCTTAGSYDDWHEGRDPAGITTQDRRWRHGSIRCWAGGGWPTTWP